jgi:hypothetical protein
VAIRLDPVDEPDGMERTMFNPGRVNLGVDTQK